MERVPPERLALDEASTADLVREAFDEAKELVRIEVALAKEEVTNELERAKKAAIALGVAAASVVVVICVLSTALVIALGGTALVALAIAGCFVLLAAAVGYLGWTLMPKSPLGRTRRRLEGDVKELKERVA